MLQEFSAIRNEVKFLFPSVENIEGVVNHKSFTPFDNLVCVFLNEVSRKLLADNEAKAYPDVVTFAFFCRKAKLSHLFKIEIFFTFEIYKVRMSKICKDPGPESFYAL